MAVNDKSKPKSRLLSTNHHFSTVYCSATPNKPTA